MGSPYRCRNCSGWKNMRSFTCSWGFISTIGTKDAAGYPCGSVVEYAMDSEGRYLFAFSSMSSHTTDVRETGKASLTVTAPGFQVRKSSNQTSFSPFNCFHLSFLIYYFASFKVAGFVFLESMQYFDSAASLVCICALVYRQFLRTSIPNSWRVISCKERYIQWSQILFIFW